MHNTSQKRTTKVTHRIAKVEHMMVLGWGRAQQVLIPTVDAEFNAKAQGGDGIH